MNTTACGDAGRFTQIADATIRAGIDTLPQAARRVAIPPARRRLALAFFEALPREDVHDVLRSRDPAVLLFDPRDPVVLAKCVDARHGLHDAPCST
jgi:hypothetical protein